MTAHAIAYLHAASPLHAGTGQALDVNDLPIQRERGTELPIVGGSGLKGVIRAECETGGDRNFVDSAFGNEDDASAGAGAVTFADARLLLFPVRSVKLLFAWVTSPYLLRRYAHDRVISGFDGDLELGALAAFARAEQDAVAAGSSLLIESSQSQPQQKGTVYVEDADLAVEVLPEMKNFAESLASRCLPELLRPLLAGRLLLVSDSLLGTFVRQCTEITPRVKLKDKEKTSDNLWYEEALPAETLLYSVVSAEKTRGMRKRDFSGTDHIATLSKAIASAQFGGKASVGRGLCNVSWEVAS